MDHDDHTLMQLKNISRLVSLIQIRGAKTIKKAKHIGLRGMQTLQSKFTYDRLSPFFMNKKLLHIFHRDIMEI